MAEHRTIRGVDIAFDFVRRGTELIVFLHGVGANRIGWEPQLEYFANLGFSVAAMDARGSGASQCRDSSGKAIPITMADFASDVDALIRELGFAHATWVGNSMGGVIIMEAFRQGVTTVSRAVLCNTFAMHPESAVILPRPGSALKDRSLAQLAAERIPLAHSPNIAPEVLSASIEAMATKDVETYLLSWRETWSHDYRALLTSVQCPSLVITGSLDKITPPFLGEEIAALIPNAQHRLIEGASHLSNLDCPADFNVILQAFLADS